MLDTKQVINADEKDVLLLLSCLFGCKLFWTQSHNILVVDNFRWISSFGEIQWSTHPRLTFQSFPGAIYWRHTEVKRFWSSGTRFAGETCLQTFIWNVPQC